jgi:Ca2+-binding RTX toxin-like protein
MEGVPGRAAPAAGEASGASAAGSGAPPMLASDALAGLCAVARFHHVAADPATLAHQIGCGPGEAASTDVLLRAAKQLGLKAKVSRTSLDRLALTPLPALALLRGEQGGVHFVILAQCDAQRVLLQDPSAASARPVIEPLEVFAQQWTGELILVTSRANLVGALAKFDFSWFIPSLVKYRRLLGEVLAISFMLQLFALVSPLFFQVVMDKVLVHRGLTTLDVLVIGLLVVVVFESLLTGLRAYVFSHTTSRIDVELGARLFRHLVQLPLAYFQARRVGDSVARVRELENIRSFLTGNALTVLLDVVFSIVFVAVMLFYSVPLTLIVLVSMPLYFGLSLAVVPILRGRLDEKFARGAENQAMLVETVSAIQTVKATALEPAFGRRWDNQLAAYVSASFRTQNLASWAHEGVNLIGKLVNAATLWYGAHLVMDNHLTVGQFVAFNMFAQRVSQPIMRMAQLWTDFQQTGISMARLGDISSANYLLNTGIEELRLVEGLDIHGTGNALDNKIIGNSRNNILDGVDGKDTMLGGAGNDTYYVDNAGDQVVEYSGEGTDTVQSSVSYTLGADVENLNLLDFSKPEKGVVDGVATLVYGYPKRNELDYMQGDATPGYLGTCALTSIANLLTQAQRPTTEAQVVQVAIDNRWAVTDPTKPAYQRGGSNYVDQQSILDSYGVRNDLLAGYDEQGVANLVRNGCGVVLAVNAGVLWGDATHKGSGAVNHAVTVTGAVYGETSGQLMGFYIADSGRQKVSDMTRFVSIEQFRAAANVPSAYAIYTLEPLKFWNENIGGQGNALDNVIVGNRGDNVLAGGLGRDTLAGGAGRDVLRGGAGGDTYVFGRGAGIDTIEDFDATTGSVDTVRFDPGITADQIWFEREGNSLEVSVIGTADKLVIADWYLGNQTHVEQFQTSDGKMLLDSRINVLANAMAAFSPPAAGQTTLAAGYQSSLGTLIAANWH